SKPDEPDLDEDFTAAARTGKPPKDWVAIDGSFRTSTYMGQPCLETFQAGPHFVQLPQTPLSGDFTLDVECILPYGSALTIDLGGDDPQLFTIHYDGSVTVGTRATTW